MIGAGVGFCMHKRRVAKYRARGAAFDTQYHARNETVRKPEDAFFGSAKKYDDSGVEMI